MSDLSIKKNALHKNLQKIDNFLLDQSHPVEKLVIMTIGNILLSDDGVGPMIYEELSSSGLDHPSILLLNAELNPENYFKTIFDFNPSHLIIIDSIEANLHPGTILFFKNKHIEDKLFSQGSTHMISLNKINSYLLQNHKNLKILNIGIQVKSTEFGLQSLDFNVYETAIILKDYLLKILTNIFPK